MASGSTGFIVKVRGGIKNGGRALFAINNAQRRAKGYGRATNVTKFVKRGRY